MHDPFAKMDNGGLRARQHRVIATAIAKMGYGGLRAPVNPGTWDTGDRKTYQN